MKALYKHDCSRCEFCGTIFDKDYYICSRTDKRTGLASDTLVIRESKEPSDYASIELLCDGKIVHAYVKTYILGYAVYSEWRKRKEDANRDNLLKEITNAEI